MAKKDIPKNKRNLMEGALDLSLQDSAKVFLSEREKMTAEEKDQLNKEIKAVQDLKELHMIDARKKSDEELQTKIDQYNKSLKDVNPMFEGISIPENMVIVKLARLPHLNANGFVIPRIIHEPSRSGADIQGHAITNPYPYYDFGYVVKSTSKWVPEKQFAQLSYDAIMQQFQREEGKWRYHMPNEFKFWNKREEDRSINDLECYVFIRDYQVEAVFDKKYKPVYD